MGGDLTDLVIRHYQSMIAFYGPTLGNRVARKHLGWYMDYAGTDVTFRRRILTETSPDQVMHLLETLFYASHKDVA
jgi:tRNA-dihydrouridine synthase